MNVLSFAQRVFNIESEAIAALAQRLDHNFEAAAAQLANCQGRIICCGMGKSGLVAKLLAATFSSIGCPAFFLHPAEAIHGDLGLLTASDCFLSISNSGETDELLQILPYIQRKALPHIALLGQRNSTLARHVNWVLDIGVEKEASDIQAVPMASIATALAMGHALAAAMIELRSFQQADFLQYHPGGSLGHKLLTPVADRMQTEELPLVLAETSPRDLLLIMSKGKLGLAVVVQQNHVLGIITDGDLRRALEKSEDNFFGLKAKDLMTDNPKSIVPQASIFEAEKQMKLHKINALLVLEQGQILGVIAKQHIR